MLEGIKSPPPCGRMHLIPAIADAVSKNHESCLRQLEYFSLTVLVVVDSLIYQELGPPLPLKSGTGVLQTRRDNQYVFLPHWLLVN